LLADRLSGSTRDPIFRLWYLGICYVAFRQRLRRCWQSSPAHPSQSVRYYTRSAWHQICQPIDAGAILTSKNGHSGEYQSQASINLRRVSINVGLFRDLEWRVRKFTSRSGSSHCTASRELLVPSLRTPALWSPARPFCLIRSNEPKLGLHLRSARAQSACQKASGGSGSRCTLRIFDCGLFRHEAGRSPLEFHILLRVVGSERRDSRQAAVLGMTRQV
jgi:hypothetical protein